jgi:uncharacterized protein (TIGR02996 family)
VREYRDFLELTKAETIRNLGIPRRLIAPTPEDLERQGLLEDVLAHPGEDGPRLVLADWLEDHQQIEHATFIRDQILLSAPIPPEQCGGYYCDVHRGHIVHRGCAVTQAESRLELLLGIHNPRSTGRQQPRWLLPSGYEWFNLKTGMTSSFDVYLHGKTNEVTNWPTPGPVSMLVPCWATCRRGFICRFHIRLEDWEEKGPGLVRQQPIEKVFLSNRRPCESHYYDMHRYTWMQRTSDEILFPPKMWSTISSVIGSNSYETRSAAEDALSAGLLAWARG